MTANHENLRSARQKAGFASASAAARRFGWKDASYRHHENGTRSFGADQAKQYAAAFGIEPARLMGLDSSDGAEDAVLALAQAIVSECAKRGGSCGFNQDGLLVVNATFDARAVLERVLRAS